MILSLVSVTEQSLSKFYKELNTKFRNYTLGTWALSRNPAFNFHFSSYTMSSLEGLRLEQSRL